MLTDLFTFHFINLGLVAITLATLPPKNREVNWRFLQATDTSDNPKQVLSAGIKCRHFSPPPQTG